MARRVAIKRLADADNRFNVRRMSVFAPRLGAASEYTHRAVLE